MLNRLARLREGYFARHILVAAIGVGAETATNNWRPLNPQWLLTLPPNSVELAR